MNLEITSEDFSKISKRLQKQVTNDTTKLPLTHIQEQLAQAFGFRNFHALSQHFDKESPEVEYERIQQQEFKEIEEKNYSFLKELSVEQIVNIFFTFLRRKENNMWVDRAGSLIRAVIPALIYMMKERELIFTTEVIKEYTIFDNLFKLYRNRRDFPNPIRNGLREYLISLPGFDDTPGSTAQNQNTTVREQHGYAYTQFISIFRILSIIEKPSLVIIPSVLVGIIKNSNHVNLKIRHEIIYKIGKFDEEIISNFLSDEILTLIQDNKKRLTNKNIYLTDLLVLSLNYLKEEKRYAIFNAVEQFTSNYEITQRYSEELIKIVNQ